MKTVYFDNNATTRVAPEVVEEMLPYFSEFYGNPSSMHSFGNEVNKKIIEARKKVAELLGAKPSEIIFTSCGTESDSTAVLSAVKNNPGKKHIMTSVVEHPAILNLFADLEKQGYRTTYVPVDEQGRLDTEFLYSNLTEDTAVVSIIWANNETGVIFPVEEIASECHKKGVLFHTDAVQAVGKIEINLAETNIDMLSLSGHKLHAPKGVGALYIREKTPFTHFLAGGHQEEGKRGGTENTASIIGLGKACELAAKYMEKENTFVKELRDKMERELIARIPNSYVNGTLENRLPNTLNISYEYIEGEAILLMMNQYGICASSGSACTSGSLEPSHVLMAMKVPYTRAHASTRYSLSIYNTEEEVDFLVEKMVPIVAKLREMSPFWKNKE